MTLGFRAQGFAGSFFAGLLLCRHAMNADTRKKINNTGQSPCFITLRSVAPQP
jgi:hypothetical protein